MPPPALQVCAPIDFFFLLGATRKGKRTLQRPKTGGARVWWTGVGGMEAEWGTDCQCLSEEEISISVRTSLSIAKFEVHSEPRIVVGPTGLSGVVCKEEEGPA